MTADLNVKVDATTTGYEAAIGRAVNSTNRYEASLKSLESDLMKLEKQLDDDVAAALQRQHDAMDKVGKGAFVFGAAVAAGLGMAVNEAVKWESAWAGVTKTVDGTASEMADLEDGLRKLATSLPATHEEIAAVAEAAGQLGIKREAILGFTKTMIDLSETTNLTADQAATDMARFANIMQTPQDQIDRLGASLVALGNDGASTEADILSMGMRIAGAGATIGLTEGEVMGLANALSSVGIEAEAGGSAISAVMKTIEVKSTQGAEALSGFAKVAGMSSQEFLDLWTADSAAGLNAFVTGLGRVESQGGNTVATLQELGFTQIRQSDALLRLANSGDLLTESLALGNQAWEDNSALLDEAAKRYDTTEAKVQVARNTLRDAAITAGDVLLPALAGLADVTSDVLRAWQDLPGPLKTGAVLLAALAAAIALAGGASLIAIPKIAAFNTAVAGLEAGALKSAGTRLQGLASVLAGPWGIAIAAGVTALGFFAAKHGDAARKVDELRATLDEQTGALTENSREWAKKELLESGALKAAQGLGLNLADVTDAALGQADALERVNDVLLSISGSGHGFSGDVTPFNLDKVFSSDQAKAATTVMDALGSTHSVLKQATSDQHLLAAAGESAADGTKKAGDAQQGTTAAWQDGADAAGDLGEEVKTLGDQLADLSEAYLNQREAGRAVRSSLREIRDSLKEYRKEHDGLKGAFKDGTKSGDEFAAMLDGLAGDYQNQLDAAERAGASEKRLHEIWKTSVDRLYDEARQLGLTKDEAKAYVEQVLDTPKNVKTYFEAATESATADVLRFRGLLDGIDGDTVRTFIQVTTTRNDIGESGGPPRGGPSRPSAPSNSPGRFQEANGGIVQAFAGGGFTSSGDFVQRVPQLRTGGGSIRWNEPETGWEAYISGKPGMEDRNRNVWLEAGRRLGFGAGGGTLGGPQVVVVRESGPLIGNLTVPAVPGASSDDAHRTVSAVMYQVDLAARGGRWGQG